MKLIVRDLKEESEFPSDFENEELRLHRYILEEIIKENEDGTVLARVIGYSSNRKGFDDLIHELNNLYNGIKNIQHNQEIPD